MSINQWTVKEVNRAESTWGQKTPPYSVDMFEFLMQGCKSWLDLGCGFGRFLNYLTDFIDDPDYIGYDSSADMVKRIKERFPVYESRIFHRDITAPIVNRQDAVLCSAVLIHITLEDQLKVLKNIVAVRPKRVAFDINSHEEARLAKTPHLENIIRGAEGNFRMTWQSHYVFTDLVNKLFIGYNISQKQYTVNKTRKKVAYMLEATTS